MNDDIIILERFRLDTIGRSVNTKAMLLSTNSPACSVRAFGTFMSAFQDISVILSVSSCP
jgi:hypothetical protein